MNFSDGFWGKKATFKTKIEYLITISHIRLNKIVKMIRTQIEPTDTKFRIQLGGFCGVYPEYASLLKVDADRMIALNKGNAVVQVIFAKQESLQTFAVGFTAYKDLVRRGNAADVLTPYPTMPVYPSVMPPLCNENVEAQFKIVIQECIDSGNLSETIAKALGIFAEPLVDVLSEGTPNLTVKIVGGGHPALHCTMGDYEGFEVWKDTGSGFVRFDVSMSPSYIDMSPLPASGTDVIWTYKVIYRLKNVQVGNWSMSIPIAVKGI